MTKLRGQLFHDQHLKHYTSWKVGGCAKQLYKPADLQDLQCFMKQLPEDEAILWLGLGSNTLIRDGGFNGTVILTQGCLKEIKTVGLTQVYAQAGVASAALARFAARENLAGIEFLAGVPGTVGGALRMNAGCFGSETWEYVQEVVMMDRQGRCTTRAPSSFEIAYRHVAGMGDAWFVAATFHLKAGDKQKSLEKIRALLDRRAKTQPTGEHNCGSVFRNPPNDYAARLIEACALKNQSVGGAVVSEKHANFINSTTDCTAADIEHLIAYVQATVDEKFGIQLQYEVHIVGEHQ